MVVREHHCRCVGTEGGFDHFAEIDAGLCQGGSQKAAFPTRKNALTGGKDEKIIWVTVGRTEWYLEDGATEASARAG